MSYKITITETRTVKKIVGNDWAVIGTKEIARDESFIREDPEKGRTRIEDVRGYTPTIEKLVSETVEVLEQVVEDLDLKEVIKAINGMGRKKTRKSK